MGVSESSLASFHSLTDIEDAIKHSRTTPTEQTCHGWLASLSSQQIEVSSNGLKAILTKSEPDTHYRVTGNREYTEGVHLFQFRWEPDSQKQVCVGVCTKAMSKLENREMVLGTDDQCVGWDLHARKIFFNGCAIKNYPENKLLSYKIPHTFTMILNMEQGSLSFKADGEDLGVAMSGLKHIAQELLLVASLSTEKDSIEVRYLGGSDTVKESEEGEEEVGDICFHDRCGVNIQLSENNTKAVRTNPRQTYNSATVLTNRSLNIGESVKIKVVEMDEMSKWTGSLVLGVTTLSPDYLSFPLDAMAECTEGNTWTLRMQELKHNGKYVKDTAFDLDDVKSDDLFEISTMEKTVKITCRKKEVISFPVPDKQDLYLCVDVYGQTASISISSGKKGKPSTTKKPTAITVAALFEMMQKKDVKEIIIILKGINLHLNSPSYGIKGKKLKKFAAEELVKSKSAVQTMKEYMEFLISKHPGNSQAAACYKALMSVYLCYTGVNLQFARKLGDTGVLALVMNHIRTMDTAIYDTKGNTENLETVLMIMHNSAQAKENRKTFQSLKFVQEAKKIAEQKSVYGVECRMTAVLAMSYVHLEDELPNLLIDEELAGHIVATLSKTASSPDQTYNRWNTRKLVSGIANIAAHKPNASSLIRQGILLQLLHLLNSYEAYDKECALNAIWGLINDDTSIEVFATDGLLAKIDELKAGADDSVKQAAVRVLAKAKAGQVIGNSTKEKCNYKHCCERFKASLQLSDAFFNPNFDMCYCENCHAQRGDGATFKRGNPAKSYGIPVGWCRFGLKSHPRADALKAFDKWHRAFHGTRVDSVAGILTVGDIAPAGRKVLGGKDIKELPGHFSEEFYKPEGFNTKRVFLSPSMRYSGVPAYAKPCKFSDSVSSKTYNAQVAFQVLVNPDSYSVEKETIGADGEIDPNFSNHEIEWVVEEHGAILLYGLLVKVA